MNEVITGLSFNTVNGKYYCNLTIDVLRIEILYGFNTVNGKYYCNELSFRHSFTEQYKFQYRKR